MLQDGERINAYRMALSLLSHKKVVVDVGAGTGILSMIAMDYGATCVYAIEMSKICQVAIKNFQKKTYRRKISMHQCLAEEFTLGNDKADLIVSEWMGYFLIFENMLPSVLAVRDNCLKEDGAIIPKEASLYIVGYFGDCKDEENHEPDKQNSDYIEAIVATIEETQIATRKSCIFDINLLTV
jgi:type I protein arginine methyltransferase